MKTINSFSTLILTLLLFASNSHAGVDSSGGGESGSFKMSSGFKPGAFSVSMNSASGGSLADILKYFKLAGAQVTSINGGTSYVLEATSIFQSNKPPEKNPLYYQMQTTLLYNDVYSVVSVGQETRLEFRGPLAAALYEAMKNNGALMIAQNLNEKNEVVGLSLLEKHSLMCSKREEGGLRGGTSCTFFISTALPENSDKSCPECGG